MSSSTPAYPTDRAPSKHDVRELNRQYSALHQNDKRNTYQGENHPRIIISKRLYDASTHVNTKGGSHEGKGNERRTHLQISVFRLQLTIGTIHSYIPLEALVPGYLPCLRCL